jgi:predicted dehydrogenase
MKQLSLEGKLGEVISMQAIEHYNGGRTYHSRWNRLKEFSGGLWLHKGTHDFDVINHIMGEVRPARVSAFCSVMAFLPDRLPFQKREGIEPGPTCNECAYLDQCPDAYPIEDSEESPRGRMFSEEAAQVDGYHKNLCMFTSDKDTHDQGTAIIEFENGASATHTECFATPMSNRLYYVDGMTGHMHADLRANRVDYYPRWSNDCLSHKIGPVTGGHGGADPVMTQDFIDCIRTGKKPMADAVDGVWAVAVACAAEISREEHRVVEISELLDKDSDLLG